MKKIFAGIVLPTLAAVAVIGSGFSVWFFGENQDKVSTDASVQVEMLMRIGTLTMNTGASTLHLDQTQNVRNFILDPANKYVNPNVDGKSTFDKAAFDKINNAGKIEAKGLYLTADTTGENAFDGSILYGSSGTDIIPGAWKVEIVTTFTFTGKIRDYVGMKMDNTDNTHGTWKNEPTKGSNSTSYSFTWNADKKDLSLSLPMDNGTKGDLKFEYLTYNNQYSAGVDSKRSDYSPTSNPEMNTAEPHNDAERIALFNAARESTLTIETVATIVDDTTGA